MKEGCGWKWLNAASRKTFVRRENSRNVKPMLADDLSYDANSVSRDL